MTDQRIRNIVIVGGGTNDIETVIKKCVAVMPSHKDSIAGKACAADRA